MPYTLRNRSKCGFKRRNKRVPFNILTSENCYLDIRDIIIFKRSSFLKLLLYFQNNKYSPNCIPGFVDLYLKFFCKNKISNSAFS